VVPEIAARAHLDHLDGLIRTVMDEAGLEFGALDAVAATAGPGLIGGLIVGTTMGKAIAAAHKKPFIAINHLEGHALSARLVDDVAFPYLLLLVSGGHCQVLAVEGVGRYARLGTTVDDAAGEAFDKTAKLLRLPFPGGPAVERAAKGRNPARFPLPRPMLGRAGCDFSFSGLKTAVRHAAAAFPPGPYMAADVGDLCAAFQQAVGDVLVDRTINALAMFRARHAVLRPPWPTLVVAGGVAANAYLRLRLETMAEDAGARLVVPPQKYCTDNAAMIAWAGIERLARGPVDERDAKPRPRWPLDPDAGNAA
jgi:N6-L-threonylcarbamoyladenine synthase